MPSAASGSHSMTSLTTVRRLPSKARWPCRRSSAERVVQRAPDQGIPSTCSRCGAICCGGHRPASDPAPGELVARHHGPAPCRVPWCLRNGPARDEVKQLVIDFGTVPSRGFYFASTFSMGTPPYLRAKWCSGRAGLRWCRMTALHLKVVMTVRLPAAVRNRGMAGATGSKTGFPTLGHQLHQTQHLAGRWIETSEKDGRPRWSRR